MDGGVDTDKLSEPSPGSHSKPPISHRSQTLLNGSKFSMLSTQSCTDLTRPCCTDLSTSSFVACTSAKEPEISDLATVVEAALTLQPSRDLLCTGRGGRVRVSEGGIALILRVRVRAESWASAEELCTSSWRCSNRFSAAVSGAGANERRGKKQRSERARPNRVSARFCQICIPSQ